MSFRLQPLLTGLLTLLVAACLMFAPSAGFAAQGDWSRGSYSIEVLELNSQPDNLINIESHGSYSQFDSVSGNLTSQLKNNYLKHAQRKEVDRLKALSASKCSGRHRGTTKCRAIEHQLQELEDISTLNTAQLLSTCATSLNSADCQAHLQENSNYVQWAEGTRNKRFNVNNGLYYHEQLAGQGTANLDQSIAAAFDEKPDIDKFSDLDEAIHENNKKGAHDGYFWKTDRLKAQGQLLDDYAKLNDANDPLQPVSCADNIRATCYVNERIAIETQLMGYGALDIIAPCCK